MRQSIVFCVALLALAFTVQAQVASLQPSYPSTNPICSQPGYTIVDRTSAYTAGVKFQTSICVLSYYTVCATVTGATPCNTATGTCLAVKYDWNNVILNPTSAAVMAQAPEVCTSAGGYFHPETAVFSIAQPVLSSIVGAICLVLVVFAVRRAGRLIGLWLLFGLMCVSCMFLLFGVWYLNAYLAMLVTIPAVGLFATRNKPAVLVGCLCLFVGLLWFTYSAGLGSNQHSFRYDATLVSDMRDPRICNNFYRGYFTYAPEQHTSYESQLITTNSYCSREYIGVELFFVFFIELLFLMLLAYGGYTAVSHHHHHHRPEEVTKAE